MASPLRRRSEDRPPHHRRRARWYRDEPLADDERVGDPNLLYIESLAYQFSERLRERGIRVPDIAIAGGFADEANVFKALAMGSPYVRAVCMGRALMIPGHGREEYRKVA